MPDPNTPVKTGMKEDGPRPQKKGGKGPESDGPKPNTPVTTGSGQGE